MIHRAGPRSETARELLELMQKDLDLENRGLTEIVDSPEPGQTFFLAGVRVSGSPYKIKSRLFREAVEELVAQGWLYPPQDAGKTRLYEFKPQS